MISAKQTSLTWGSWDKTAAFPRCLMFTPKEWKIYLRFSDPIAISFKLSKSSIIYLSAFFMSFDDASATSVSSNFKKPEVYLNKNFPLTSFFEFIEAIKALLESGLSTLSTNSSLSLSL